MDEHKNGVLGCECYNYEIISISSASNWKAVFLDSSNELLTVPITCWAAVRLTSGEFGGSQHVWAAMIAEGPDLLFKATPICPFCRNGLTRLLGYLHEKESAEEWFRGKGTKTTPEELVSVHEKEKEDLLKEIQLSRQ